VEVTCDPQKVTAGDLFQVSSPVIKIQNSPNTLNILHQRCAYIKTRANALTKELLELRESTLKIRRVQRSARCSSYRLFDVTRVVDKRFASAANYIRTKQSRSTKKRILRTNRDFGNSRDSTCGTDIANRKSRLKARATPEKCVDARTLNRIESERRSPRRGNHSLLFAARVQIL